MLYTKMGYIILNPMLCLEKVKGCEFSLMTALQNLIRGSCCKGIKKCETADTRSPCSGERRNKDILNGEKWEVEETESRIFLLQHVVYKDISYTPLRNPIGS